MVTVDPDGLLSLAYLGIIVSAEPPLSYSVISELTFTFGVLTLPYCNSVAFMLHAQQGDFLVACGAHLHVYYYQTSLE